MQVIASNCLDMLRPEIKRRWEALMRTAPELSPMAHPDLMVFLMDEILDQLSRSLDRPGADAGLPPITGSLEDRCTCKLNPLVPYFLTGRQALTDVTAAELGPQFEPMIDRYTSLAARELDAFCGVCFHRKIEACSVPVQSGG